MQSPVLELQDLRKYFGGVKAVDGVTFSIYSGEVHAIVGENGAGKSTLMNILAGVYPANSGQMLLQGQPYTPGNPGEARAKGVSIVFQELALFPSLPVDANVFIDKEIVRGPRLAQQEMRDRTMTILEQMRVQLDPSQPVGSLSIGQQQWVEIARALTDKARVLILDEPNSALNQYETEALFELIRRLKSQGITVIYISHRLEEVFRIADRITVMRDGHYVGTWPAAETTISDIVAAMVGCQTVGLFSRSSRVLDRVVLEVRDLTLEGKLQDISLTAYAGEVVGLAGLAGAGVTDLFEILFGIQQASQGRIFLDGRSVDSSSPLKAKQHQIAMVPSDRRGLGLMLNWSVLNNITLGVLHQLSRLGIINNRRSTALAEEYVNRLHIMTDSLNKSVLYLSGGNQQKVLLARWLATEPRLLILDDPTRGIDVGAKQEVYALIDQIAATGVAILLTSSELDEVLALSDRILVLRRGRLIAELDPRTWDKGLVMEFVAGDPERGRATLEDRQSLAALNQALGGDHAC